MWALLCMLLWPLMAHDGLCDGASRGTQDRTLCIFEHTRQQMKDETGGQVSPVECLQQLSDHSEESDENDSSEEEIVYPRVEDCQPFTPNTSSECFVASSLRKMSLTRGGVPISTNDCMIRVWYLLASLKSDSTGPTRPPCPPGVTLKDRVDPTQFTLTEVKPKSGTFRTHVDVYAVFLLFVIFMVFFLFKALKLHAYRRDPISLNSPRRVSLNENEMGRRISVEIEDDEYTTPGPSASPSNQLISRESSLPTFEDASKPPSYEEAVSRQFKREEPKGRTTDEEV